MQIQLFLLDITRRPDLYLKQRMEVKVNRLAAEQLRGCVREGDWLEKKR